MITVKDFYDALNEYESNKGWGRWAWGAVGLAGGKHQSLNDLWAYYNDNLKGKLQPSDELTREHVEAIRAIIKKYLPSDCCGTDATTSAQDFLRLATLHQNILLKITKLLDLPEYWLLAQRAFNLYITALNNESYIESPSTDDLVYGRDLASTFGADLAQYFIDNKRVDKKLGTYNSKSNWIRSHCYDVDYTQYHANRIGDSNLVLAHAPTALAQGDNNLAKFIEQLIYSPSSPVMRIIAIGTPKKNNMSRDAEFIDYLVDVSISGGEDFKLKTTVSEHAAFSKQHSSLLPNLRQVNLSCDLNGVEKSVEVLLLKMSTVTGISVATNAGANLEQLSPQALQVIDEFINTANGNVAIHCHDGITQASALLLTLELVRQPYKYFNPNVDQKAIQAWIREMRLNSTRAFVPNKDVLDQGIKNALVALIADAEQTLASSPNFKKKNERKRN